MADGFLARRPSRSRAGSRSRRRARPAQALSTSALLARAEAPLRGHRALAVAFAFAAVPHDRYLDMDAAGASARLAEVAAEGDEGGSDPRGRAAPCVRSTAAAARAGACASTATACSRFAPSGCSRRALTVPGPRLTARPRLIRPDDCLTSDAVMGETAHAGGRRRSGARSPPRNAKAPSRTGSSGTRPRAST